MYVTSYFNKGIRINADNDETWDMKCAIPICCLESLRNQSVVVHSFHTCIG